MATVYHRDDAGAPTYSFSTGTTSSVHFEAFKLILKTCLIGGYGARPPAGWSLTAEGTNYLVLRNGSLSGYVCFTNLGNHIEIYLASTFTGMSDDVMTGDGLKTGLASGNSLPQKLYIGYVANSSSHSSWYVVADAKSFYFQGGGNSSDYSSATASVMVPLYVGEDSAGNFISVGGTNTSSTSGISGVFDQSGFTALKDPTTGLLVDQGGISVITPGLTIAGSTGASWVFNLVEVPLNPTFWALTGGASAGKLRGVVQTPAIMAHYPSAAAQCLGHVGTLYARNFNTPLPIDGANTYFIGVSGSQSARHLVTDNPEFW